MDNASTGDNLRNNLCRTFCSYYKPGEKEELTCLGYQVVARLLKKGTHMDFIRCDDLPSPASDNILTDHLCPECPFYASDCDYAEKKEKAPPCGGFMLLKQILSQGTISIDDIRNFGLNLKMNLKLYDLAEGARERGEYILGAEELQTHACYMGFGILGPGEKNREIKPGSGHEEICCMVSGTVTLCSGDNCFFVGPGQAFHLRGEQSWIMNNDGPSEAVYILAGGHSEHHEHH
ncbi:MAG: hypothetical protein WA610_04655 [Thermodesulfovibrionales bacterium]